MPNLLADIISPPKLWRFVPDVQENVGTSTDENFEVVFTDDNPPDETVTVDVTISEQYDREAEVTLNPVEKGIDVVDHRRIKPIAIRMSGIVSDSPNNLLDVLQGQTQGLIGGSEESRSQDAYRKLINIFEKPDPITVVTRLDTFVNMTVQSFSVKKNDSGLFLGFDCSLIELRFATTERVAVSVAPSVKHTAPKKPKVKKPVEVITAPTGSLLQKLNAIPNPVKAFTGFVSGLIP